MKKIFIRLLATAFCSVLMLFSTQTVIAQNALTTFGISGTTAASAYSLRKLSTSYAGSAIQVRRSNDNNTSNIGFTANGDLDTATLKTFVGSNGAFVTIWYDQSGNARDLTQTTTSKQPAVISAGIIFRRNEKPTLFFDGTDDGMGFSGSNYLTTNPLTVNLVAGSNSSTSGFRRAVQGYNNWLIGPYDGTHSWYAGGWNHQSSKIWLTNAIEYFTVTQPASGFVFSYRNGTQLSSGSSFTDVPNKLGLGTEGAFAEPLNGFISEVVSYTSVLSTTNRNLMENSQKVYYPTPDNALRFDGTNDFVNIPDNSTLDVTSNYTLEAWVNISTPTAMAGIISKYQTNASNGYFLRLSGTSPNRGLDFDGLTTNSHTLLEPGKWYHIAAVKSGSARALYINGVSQTLTGSGITTAANADPIKIGSDFNGRYFNGSIDEVRIWNTAQTQADIQARMNNEISINSTGLLATYNFKQGIAAANNTGIATLVDEKFGFNGTLNNFALSGSTSNWVESYAMVVPTATAAGITSATSLTANWTAPLTGTVTNYLLDVSTLSTFASFVSGYNGLSVSGTSQAITGLTNGVTYYYRVRANKTSVTGQGGYSNTISAIPQASSNANLTNILTIAGSYSPAFSLNTTSYVATGVSNATTFITVTPYSQQVNATIQVRVNGGSYTTVASGTASSALNLNVGNNTVDIRVTAQDGTTTKTYTMIVPRFGNMLNNAGISNDNINSPAAFGLRKLSTAYVGNAIQVRRSSDNTTADIGFTANGDLDTAALKTFVGANNGFVSIWYDQSGFARNTTQTTNASQPQIVNAGVIFRKNAKPTVYFNNRWLATPNYIGYSTTFELAIIAGVQNNTSSPTFGGKTTNNIPGPWDIWGSSFYYGNGSSYSWIALTNGINAASGFSQWSFNASSSGGSARRNSSDNGSYNVASYGDLNNSLYLGTRGDGGTNLIGWISEYITLSTTLNSIEKLAVETNQLNYFNISNNNLSALAISGGSLSPNFATNTTTYNVSVINSTTSITVTPAVEYEGASLSLRVNGGAYAALASGTQSSSLPLNIGANTVEVRVLAVDGTSIKTYTINVTREPTPLTTLGITSTYAASAYSLRKLNSEYTGNAIQVRRSSDNATQNIGFTGTGDLDTTALKTFVGNNNGFISIWYDQSGFGRNLTQTTTSKQPAIISGGVIFRKDSRPTVFFDDTDDGIGYSGTNYLTTNPITVNLVASSNSSASGFRSAVQGYSGSWWSVGPHWGTHVWASYNYNHYTSPAWSTTNNELFTVIQPSSGSCSSFRNGSTVTTDSNKYVPDKLGLGTEGFYQHPLNGFISEVISYTTDLNTTDRQSMENSQANYYTSASTNANLSGLTTTAGTLAPTFAGVTIAYSATVNNATISVTVTPTKEQANATIEARVNGGSYSTVTSGSPSGALTLNLGANTIEVRVTAQDGTTTKTYTITVTRSLPLTWTGATNNEWNLASNWSPAQIPTNIDDVVIATSSNNPVLSITSAVRNLTINSGATLTVSGILQIGGNLSTSGTLNASNGALVFNGSTAQTANPNGALVQNLTINNAAGVTLTGTLNLTGILTPTSGVLTTGGFLTLKSFANNSASIASNVSGSNYISGNVTVERFVSGQSNRGRWRFLSSPVSNATVASWMTHFYVTGPGDSVPANRVNGSTLGTLNTNGWHTNMANISFPSSTMGSHPSSVKTTSIRTYNEAVIGDINNGWENLSSSSQALTPGRGFRAFIRGDRNAPNSANTQLGAGANTNIQGAVNLTLTGTVNQGEINANPTFAPSGTIGNDGWNLIGNPYACSYNLFAHITAPSNSAFFANISPTVWVYSAVTGGYVSYNTAGSGTNGGLDNGIVPPGAAFFIKANSANPVFKFQEAYKTTNNHLTGGVHKTGIKTEEFGIKYFKDSTEKDYTVIKMYNGATLNNDIYDIVKVRNDNLNLAAYGTDSVNLTATVIPPVVEETRIKLNVEATQIGTYNFDFTNMDNFEKDITVNLFDRYTNKITDVRKNIKYTFEMGPDSNQWGNNRFELILNKNTTSNEDLSNIISKTNLVIYPNPASNVLNINISNTSFKNSEIVVYNIAGTEVLKTNMANSNAQLNIEALSNGVYLINVSNENGFNKTVKFVK